MNAPALGPLQRALVYASAFFGITTESLIGMLLPLWAIDRALPPAQLGTAVALASFSPLLLAVPAGALCDRYGDRRVMLWAGLAAGVTAALYPLAGGFAAACALQLLGGLARSMSWLAAQSYAIRATPPGERNTFMGRFSFAGSVGMLLAPLLAGALVDRLGLSAGFGLMAVWGGLLAAVAVPLPEHRDGVAQGTLWRVTAGAYRQALPLLAQASLLIVMLLTLLRLSAAAVNASFYPVHLDQAGFSPASIGLMFACINGAISVGSLLAAAVIRRTSMTQVLFGSIALSVLSISAVPFFHAPLVVGLLSALHGLGLGLSLPTLLAAIGRQTAPSQRGLVIGLRTLFNRLGYFAVPVLLGALVQSFGLRGAFVATGALLLAALAATYAFLTRRRLTYD
ncbi:MFS transporter [Immundisolibacter sp.]|uniref:MFS transporter n=1 Tax=Immundisolibacter sp. TaxID=1934948 RepID=UPI002604D95C|nr:MFS transporter [Immundisolibacter sp.]MDD3650182.1 MFS transporter [Immundisolibacter sp.]